MHSSHQERLQWSTRRQFLNTTGQFSLGAVAMNALGLAAPNLVQAGNLPQNPLAPRLPEFPARAKRVIYLHMSGGPPHLDIFDYKPELVKYTGQDCPGSVLEGRRFAFRVLDLDVHWEIRSGGIRVVEVRRSSL